MLNFPAGATISSVVSDGNGNRPSGAKNLAIEDSGDHGCYAPPSSSTSQATQKGYGNLVSGEIPSCQPVSIGSQGAAPYSLSFQTLGTDVVTYLNYSSIPERYITISLPWASGSQYQILFQNSTDPSVIAGPGPLNVSPGGGTKCLLSNRSVISTPIQLKPTPPTAGYDNGNAKSSDVSTSTGLKPTLSTTLNDDGNTKSSDASTPTGLKPTPPPMTTTTTVGGNDDGDTISSHPDIGAIIGGAVGGTVVLLLMIGCVFLFLLRRRRSRKSSKSDSRTTQLDPFPGALLAMESSSSISTPMRSNTTTGGNNIDRFRNSFKTPMASTTTIANDAVGSEGSYEHSESSESLSDIQPIYHRDAGRVEIPPSYDEAATGDSRRPAEVE